MKNFYTSILTLLLLMSSLCAEAWNYDLPLSNEVLSESYNYQLYKQYDFYNGITNVNDYFTRLNGERCSGDGCFTMSNDKVAFKLNGFDTYQVVEPVEMSNFYIGIGKAAIDLRAGVGKNGLNNYGSGSRFMAIGDMKAGEIAVLQWGVNSGSNVILPSDKISGATPCTVTDISEEIHAAQTEAGLEPDAFTYWRMESDGFLVIELQRYASIQGLQIWLDANADEVVSAPSMALKAVDMTERQIELMAGESTLGYQCTTYYGIIDRGEKPLFLIDTDEVASTEEVDVLDEEGNVIGTETVVTYKQVIDPEEIANGACGENQYDGTYITVSAEDDEDGDGYVTIGAATVSDSYKFSEIVYMNVSVGEVTLNAPTMTLTGLNGVVRQYQVGWKNNTLCGEDYQLTAIVDGEEQEVNVGDYLEAEAEIGARVHADGYIDGELSVTDVVEPSVEFYRKDAAKAEAEEHDWDFVRLTKKQEKLLKGTYSDYYGIVDPETNDTTKYSFDEFMAMVDEATVPENDGIMLSPVYSGWTWDAGYNRGTLAVVCDTTWTSETEYTVAAYYAEDKLGIYPECNGLTFECAPNTKNNSTVLLYSNGDLGLYFMSRPTLTFSREAATYGEYVLVYQGAGGSNYTNSRWPSLYEVPADGLLTFQLQNGGIHVFYIDVYTREDLPADGVEQVRTAQILDNAIYDLAGRRILAPRHGLYIKNGKKYVVK